MKIFLATGNKHKIEEITAIFKNVKNIEILSIKDGIDIPEVVEDGDTFEANSAKKALEIAKYTGMITIADDSGLCVDALNGAPGVYSARYAGENATDEDRYNKVLEEMKDVPEDKRTARFVSSICCILEDGTVITAEGYSEGKIAYEPHGTEGFGYDPIFITDSGKSFAELTSEEKDAISHRGNALRILREKLLKYI